MGRSLADALHVRAAPGIRTRGVLLAGPLAFPVALGRGGILANKREGDGATPRGRFRLVRLWWRADRDRGRRRALPARRIGPQDAWCEDPADRRYNRHIELPAGAPGDRLRRDDHLYDFIIEISHNMRPRIAGRGSAVFIHVARPGFAPTAGCVAMTRARLRHLLERIGPGNSHRDPMSRNYSSDFNVLSGCEKILKKFFAAAGTISGARALGAQVLCVAERPRIESPDALSPPAPRRGFSFACPPKIAVPTRTWVAPNAIAVAKSALIPIDSSFRPLRAAILAASAKCGAGASSNGGMHIRPAIVEAVGLAAGLDEGVGVVRQHARLLRLLAGVDLDEQRADGGPAWRSPSPAPPRCLAGRPNGSRRTARPHPSPCWIAAARSGAARCPDARRAAPAISPSPPARGSRRTRAGPPRSPARSPRRRNVFDTAISVTEAGSRFASAQRPRSRRARAQARRGFAISVDHGTHHGRSYHRFAKRVPRAAPRCYQRGWNSTPGPHRDASATRRPRQHGRGRLPLRVDAPRCVALVLGTIGSVGMWSYVVALPPVQADFGIDRAARLDALHHGDDRLRVRRRRDGPLRRPLRHRVPGDPRNGAARRRLSLRPAMRRTSGCSTLAHVVIGVGSSGTFGPIVSDMSHWFRKRRGIAIGDRVMRQLSRRRGVAADHPAFHREPRLAHDAYRRRHLLPRHDGAADPADAAPLADRARRDRRQRRAARTARSASSPTPCRRCSRSPASPAASRWRCRRCISSPIAATSVTARRAAPRCSR